jgi:CHRD domain
MLRFPRVKETAPIPLFVALVLVLSSCGAEGASSSSGGETTSAETAGKTIDLTPSRDSGVSGTASFTDTQNGVEVRLDMQGFKEDPRYQRMAHIHEGGTCADDRAGNGAPIEYALTPVTLETESKGTSMTTIVGVTTDQLFSGSPRYVNVHTATRSIEEGPPPESKRNTVPPGIACGDLR